MTKSVLEGKREHDMDTPRVCGRHTRDSYIYEWDLGFGAIYSSTLYIGPTSPLKQRSLDVDEKTLGGRRKKPTSLTYIYRYIIKFQSYNRGSSTTPIVTATIVRVLPLQ